MLRRFYSKKLHTKHYSMLGMGNVRTVLYFFTFYVNFTYNFADVSYPTVYTVQKRDLENSDQLECVI